MLYEYVFLTAARKCKYLKNITPGIDLWDLDKKVEPISCGPFSFFQQLI